MHNLSQHFRGGIIQWPVEFCAQNNNDLKAVKENVVPLINLNFIVYRQAYMIMKILSMMRLLQIYKIKKIKKLLNYYKVYYKNV